MKKPKERDNKVPKSFRLSPETLAALEEMSKGWKQTMTHILEDFIKQGYEAYRRGKK